MNFEIGELYAFTLKNGVISEEDVLLGIFDSVQDDEVVLEMAWLKDGSFEPDYRVSLEEYDVNEAGRKELRDFFYRQGYSDRKKEEANSCMRRYEADTEKFVRLFGSYGNRAELGK